MGKDNKIDFTIRYGEDIGAENGLPSDFLSKVYELDQKIYGYHPAYVGCLENLVDRYNAFKQSFVFLMDEDRLAGYICFFPVCEEMWDRIMNPDSAYAKWEEKNCEEGRTVRLELIPDDDILGKDIVSDPKPDEPLRLFVISAAIHPDYRSPDHAASDLLMKEWIKYLNKLQDSLDMEIDSIAGVVVSEGGRSFARSAAFRIARICQDSEEVEDCSQVVICDGDRLGRFLSGQFYRKTFRDDIYIMLPFEADENDERLDDLPPAYGVSVASEKYDKELSLYGRYLLMKLKESRDFECSNEVSTEVTEHYLGQFNFLHTLDDYCDENDPDEEPTIIGEEKADVFLLAHRRTSMYIVLILIPNSRFSTSQAFDQVSKNYIKIRDPEITDPCVLKYIHIDDYLEQKYGLISAGTGKCLTCMTKEPLPQPDEDYVKVGDKKTTREMLNILAGETYYSLFQNFRILNKDLKKLATTNLAAYDYYRSYMSEQTIVFVLKKDVLKNMPPDEDYVDKYLRKIWPDNSGTDPEYSTEYKVLTRIGLATTMLFIMEMVMFQNTALAKMTNRVSKALVQAGNVPWEYIDRIYEDYGKTIQFWRTDNFKYYGTECEARHIRKAFENDDLKNIYNEQQEYLQKVVELNSAELERRNSMFIGIVGVVLAVFGARDYIVGGVIQKFYESLPPRWITDAETEALRTFNVLGIGGFLLAFFLLHMTGRRNFYNKMRRLVRQDEVSDKHKTDDSEE